MTVTTESVVIHQRGELCQKCGKTIYWRKRTALRKIKERDRRVLQKKKKKRKAGPVHAYRCPHGNGWHMGHSQVTRSTVREEFDDVEEGEERDLP